MRLCRDPARLQPSRGRRRVARPRFVFDAHDLYWTWLTLPDPDSRLRRAGAYRNYVISKGDTLEGIARVELGSRKRVDELKKLNPGLRPTNMQIGSTIKLPLK